MLHVLLYIGCAIDNFGGMIAQLSPPCRCYWYLNSSLCLYNIITPCLSLQVVQQAPIGMIALRSVPVQMEESVNWMELAYALKDLLGPTAQNKVFGDGIHCVNERTM